MKVKDENVRCCSDVIKDADEFVIYMFENDESSDFKRLPFDDMEVAAKFKHGSNPLTATQRKIVDDATSPSSFLENMIRVEEKTSKLPVPSTTNQKEIDKVMNDSPADLMYGMTVEEYEKKFKKVKKDFKEKRKKFEDKAKDALLEAAKLYLGDKHEKEYVQYRLKLNNSGLGSILYQIYTMEETLHSLAARIKVAGAHMSTRDVEVFTGLQRIILDAQKFQFDYLDAVEKSLKELKSDYELAEAQLSGQSGQSRGDDTVMFFRGNKEFLKSLQEMKNSMTDFIPTESKNKKLNPAADVVDIQYEETKNDKELVVTGSERNPFTGYENAPKRVRKQREDMENNEGLDDFDI